MRPHRVSELSKSFYLKTFLEQNLMPQYLDKSTSTKHFVTSLITSVVIKF